MYLVRFIVSFYTEKMDYNERLLAKKWSMHVTVLNTAFSIVWSHANISNTKICQWILISIS